MPVSNIAGYQPCLYGNGVPLFSYSSANPQARRQIDEGIGFERMQTIEIFVTSSREASSTAAQLLQILQEFK